jgi:hypothetical protein
MTTLASSLLDFILGLFRDPELAAEFQADPERVLTEHGLGDVSPADCHALLPMVADFAPVAFGGGGGGGEGSGPTSVSEDDQEEEQGGRPQHDWNGHGEDTAVIHNIRYVENHYSTDVDIDASHSIWAGGDAYAIWGDDNVIATGGSVAAGEDVEDATIDNSTDVDVDIEDSFNDNSTDVSGNGNALGNGNTLDNSTDVDVHVDDIAIGENAANVEDSENVAVGEDNVVGDTDLEVGDITSIEVDDSFNDNNLADRGGEINEDSLVVDDSLNNNDVAVAGDDVEDVDQSSDLLSDNDLDVDLGDTILVPELPQA